MEKIEREAQAFRAWVHTEPAIKSQIDDRSDEIISQEELFSPGFNPAEALKALDEYQVNLVGIAPGLTELRVGLEKKPTPGLPRGSARSHGQRPFHYLSPN